MDLQCEILLHMSMVHMPEYGSYCAILLHHMIYTVQSELICPHTVHVVHHSFICRYMAFIAQYESIWIYNMHNCFISRYIDL